MYYRCVNSMCILQYQNTYTTYVVHFLLYIIIVLSMDVTIRHDSCSVKGSFLVILAMTMTMTINSNSVLLMHVNGQFVLVQQ